MPAVGVLMKFDGIVRGMMDGKYSHMRKFWTLASFSHILMP